MYRLPWPTGVNVNNMYIHTRHNTRLTAKAKAWREEAILLIKTHAMVVPDGPLEFCLIACPPDQRRRDLDNLLKLSIDATAAALGFDDSRISVVKAFMTDPSREPMLQVGLRAATEGGLLGRWA